MARKFLTPIELPGDPTLAGHAATKGYVDAVAIAGSLPPNTILASAYGVVGDASTNNLTALNAAIAAVPTDGGTVLLPAGEIRYTGVLNLRSKLTLAGVGDPSSTLTGGTTLRQMSTTANGMAGVDITSLTLRDFTLQGPVTGSGKGIVMTRTAADATIGLHWERVTVRDFGSHGIELSNPIVSLFNAVTSRANGAHGWYVHGVAAGTAGTSCSFNACYANGNGRNGYLIEQMVYCSFNACAADSNGIGYEVTGNGAQSINFSGCGAESSEDKSVTGFTGIGFKVSGGASAIGIINCWVFNGADRAVWVTGGAYAVTILGLAENSPTVTVLNSIMVDTGCSATVFDCSTVSALALSPTSNILNDGGGGMVVGGYGWFVGEVSTESATPSADTSLTNRGWVNAQLALQIPLAQKGVANGVAPLTATGIISSLYMPLIPTGHSISTAVSGNFTRDANLGFNVRTIQATGNVTVLAPTNGVSGQVMRLRIVASGASRTVSFDTGLHISTGITRGPYTVPSGEALICTLELVEANVASPAFSVNFWAITAVTVTAP